MKLRLDLFAGAHRNTVKGDTITLIYHVTDLQYTHRWAHATFIILACFFLPPPHPPEIMLSNLIMWCLDWGGGTRCSDTSAAPPVRSRLWFVHDLLKSQTPRSGALATKPPEGSVLQ